MREPLNLSRQVLSLSRMSISRSSSSSTRAPLFLQFKTCEVKALFSREIWQSLGKLGATFSSKFWSLLQLREPFLFQFYSSTVHSIKHPGGDKMEPYSHPYSPSLFSHDSPSWILEARPAEA
jgi:hypothetical protein